MLGVGATLSACGNASDPPGKPAARPLTPAELDKALHDQVKTVVVIYAENRSFNNLFADFPVSKNRCRRFSLPTISNVTATARCCKPCRRPGAACCKSARKPSTA